MANENGAPSKEEPNIDQDRPQAKSGIDVELDKFTKTADSLVSTAPLSLWTLEAAHRGAYQEYTNFWQTKCINVREEGGAKVADIPPELVHEFSIIERRLDRSRIATKVIGNSSVVSLVSQYDCFLGGLLRCFFRARPELLNACEKNISLKELQNFETIDAVREYFIEKEIETVIRKSHTDQFEWMEKRFDLPLRKGLSSWPAFVEITERRNLIVHCGGIVSSHYLSACEQQGADCGGAKAGMELTANRPYLGHTYEVLVEIGVKLAHVLWRKLVPAERAVADMKLNDFCLDLMNEARYELSRKLLDFATGVLKTWDSEVNRLLFVVNRAQVYKWLNQDATCKKILSNQDWSAVDDRISLGVAVLRNDVPAAVALMRKLRDGVLVPKHCYRQWPIFRHFRKTAEFVAAYKEIFGEDFADIPEQSTITFHLDWSEQKKEAKPPTAQKPN